MTTTMDDATALSSLLRWMWSLGASKKARKPQHPTMERPHTLRNTSARAAQAAGIAATSLAGALLMMTTAPQATADTSAADLVSSSSSSFQPALDQLLDAMQQAVAYDSALPFATPDSDAMLLTGLQNTNYELLSAGLSRVTELFDGVFFQSPEVVAGDAADSRQYFQFFTPDIYYHATAGLAPGATYELTGTVGNGTEASPSRPKRSPVRRLSARTVWNSITISSSIPTALSPSTSVPRSQPAQSTSSMTATPPPMVMPPC